jgi:FPC/CPF motif-containing protein YcgG
LEQLHVKPDLIHSPAIKDSDTENDHALRWNPLSTDPTASRCSSYAAFNGKTITRPLTPAVPIGGELIDAHNQLRERILDQSHPCTGAVSAFSQQCYRFGFYPELTCDSAVRAVCHDLYCFCHEFTPVGDNFITFVAMFRGPAIQSERHFEDLLWNQLQGMHDLDSNFFLWDKDVDSDPASHRFSYSIGGRAMFVIGMHPKASRLARTFPYPTLVFNLHEQFENLRERGKLEGMKQTIQARETALQGSINPMLADFGENSEARQYSGRAVSDSWVCPFHRRKKSP